MAGIQFIRTNPAIDQFNAQVQRGDAERRAEEQDFRQRFQAERAIGLDKGLRQAFTPGAETAAAPAVATPSTMATPAPPPTPAIGGYVAIPPTGENVPMDFERPAQTWVGPREQPTAAAVTQSAAPASAVQLPTARPQTSAGPSSYRDVMTSLSKTPGAGSTMMNLYSSERRDRSSQRLEERKIHLEGIKLFTDASKNGDVATMRAVSQRYDLGIPPEALNRREIMAELAAGTNTAKGFGITNDERALAFGMGYVDALASGADPRRALQAGFTASQKVKVAPTLKNPHYYTAADNSVQAVGEDLVARPVQGPRARPPQPPFALTQGGSDSRDQALRDRAIDNAMKEAGRRWGRMASDEKQRRIDYHYDFLRTGKPGTPPPSRASAAPGAPPGPANDPLGLRR